MFSARNKWRTKYTHTHIQNTGQQHENDADTNKSKAKNLSFSCVRWILLWFNRKRIFHSFFPTFLLLFVFGFGCRFGAAFSAHRTMRLRECLRYGLPVHLYNNTSALRCNSTIINKCYALECLEMTATESTINILLLLFFSFVPRPSTIVLFYLVAFTLTAQCALIAHRWAAALQVQVHFSVVATSTDTSREINTNGQIDCASKSKWTMKPLDQAIAWQLWKSTEQRVNVCECAHVSLLRFCAVSMLVALIRTDAMWSFHVTRIPVYCNCICGKRSERIDRTVYRNTTAWHNFSWENNVRSIGRAQFCRTNAKKLLFISTIFEFFFFFVSAGFFEFRFQFLFCCQ